MSLSPLHDLHLKNHLLSRRYARLRITLSRTRSIVHTLQPPTPGPLHPLALPTPRAPSPLPPPTTNFFTAGPIHPSAPGFLARSEALVSENARYERRIRRLERKISRTRGMVEELLVAARWRAREVREGTAAGERIVAALEAMGTGARGW